MGLKVQAIARIFGVSRQTITKTLKKEEAASPDKHSG